MLQIALCPAPVARGHIEQRRRALLERAGQPWDHVDAPAAAPDQRCFDEIMAHDMAAEGLGTAQIRQAATIGKCARPDDGVMAPVVSVAAMPERQPTRNHGAIDAAGELLEAGDVWMIPAFGSSSMSWASVTSVSPDMMLSASSTSICS